MRFIIFVREEEYKPEIISLDHENVSFEDINGGGYLTFKYMYMYPHGTILHIYAKANNAS